MTGYVSVRAAPGCSWWPVGTPPDCHRHRDPSPPALPDSPLQQETEKVSEEIKSHLNLIIFPEENLHTAQTARCYSHLWPLDGDKGRRIFNEC